MRVRHRTGPELETTRSGLLPEICRDWYLKLVEARTWDNLIRAKTRDSPVGVGKTRDNLVVTETWNNPVEAGIQDCPVEAGT